MSAQLFKRLKAFKKKSNVSIADLCKEIGAHFTTYHKWKNAGKISGPYKKIVEEFLEKHEALVSFNNSVSSTSDIAVIGVACYYPGASNIKELWENILTRRVQFRRMLDQRLPLSKYYDPDPKAPDKTYLTKAAFLENYQFDWGKLRIPKKTVESTDIAHWLALDIALKTFEDARYKLSDIPLQNTGVIVGNTLTGEQTRSQTLRLRWPYVQGALNATLNHIGMGAEERGRIEIEMEQIYKSAFYSVTEDSLAGGLANTIAGRICNYLNLKGGGYIVDGACSSSLLAVATAANALKMGDMDLALAGGVDISLDPFELVGFAKAGALAKDKMSVYDQSANGFLPGEGCGFVLLKRLADAVKDKNYVYGVIKGWGISSDGKGGIMEPSSSGQSFAIGRAYKNLSYKIADVDFVEGHGTGTTKGDRVELEGIATAIEQTVSKENKNKRTCGVTSFKSIVGHTKAAAGIGGLIKAILAVNQRILPPTASCITPNDVFKDKAKNLYPLIQGRLLDPKKIARAGISSAGFGGINCHVTIESKDEPKPELKPKIDERALFVSGQYSEIFVFTSRSITHLKKVISKFKEDLRNISIAEMADLAALLNKKVKQNLPIKASIVTDTPEHLYDALVGLEKDIEAFLLENGKIHKIKANDINTHITLSCYAKQARVGFLYPGQGSQRLNMTRTLVERYKWAQDLLDLSKLPLYDHIYKATDKFFTKEEQQEFEVKLADTRITQPAIVTSSLIWTEFLSKLGIKPLAVAGHSLGELTAFYKAGGFSKETLIKFAELRGQLMASHGRQAGSMVSLFCSRQKAEEYVSKISGNVILANINSPSQMIVSGGKREIEKVIELAEKEDISTRRLNVSNAFHSSLMQPASIKIQASKVLPDTFETNGVKVYSGISASSLEGKVNVKAYFASQVVSQVNFVGLVESISKECDLFIEVGPGRVLTDLVKTINYDQRPFCLPIESTAQNDKDLNIVLAELFVRNVPIKWEELYKNRLIKVFVPASRKKFIENQCERPLKLGNQVLKSDSIQPAFYSKEESQQADEIIPGGLPTVEGKDNIADLLIDLTHKLTGFDKSSLSLNLRLLDDLNLDSIKAAELIGQATRALGIAGQIDPSKISNNTLSQISDRLHQLVDEQGKAGLAAKETTADIFKRYHDKPWVRNFVQHLIPQEITTRNVNQLNALKDIIIISEPEEDSLVEAIKEKLKSVKVKIRKKRYSEPEGKVEINTDCLIAILPKPSQFKDLNKGSLKQIIERFNKIVNIANSNKIEKDAFIVFVQFGGGNFGENNNLKDIAAASAKSLASTLFLERPDLKVRVIDFEAQVSDKEISLKVLDEFQTYERFNVVGYDAKLNRKVVIYDNSNPVDYKKRNIVWLSKDVVLVTGGAKGITAQCALEFARATKANMALVGRSPVPKKNEDNEINQTIKLFEKENLKAAYYQCDVTDEKNVAEVIKEIEQKQGKITGFIHGAGLNSLKRLKQVSINEALNESLPKVMGAVNVCKTLSQPPKLIAAITSIIGITGMEGSGWYGLANEVLNLYLHQFKAQHPKTEVVAVAYSVWGEVGMGAKLGSVERLAHKGIGAIPVEEGIKRFHQLIENDSGTQQVIVAARVAGIESWKSPTLKTSRFRFIEKVEYVLPGVELIAQAQLNVKDDSYLLDHNWKGSLLFPFVFGFEAMAQAVAYVLGIDEFDYIKAKDINLERPISVPQESGTTIEIHAVVLESGKQVKVDIYSQETGYQEPHFSAVFEIASKPKVEKIDHSLEKRAKEIIDLDVQTDIYGPILFQGNMFQGIEQIHELSYNEKTKEGECILTSVYNKSANAFLKEDKKFNNRFLIGEPFFLDTMLQSMQLIIPQDISLPRDIEAIELTPTKEKTANQIIDSKIKRIDEDYYRGDAQVVKDGLYFKVKNCRLKILDNVPSNPSANDLVNPTQRDQKIIGDKILSLSKELGFTSPVILTLNDERLKDSSKELRHKIELPLIKEAVGELLSRDKKSSKPFNVKWLKSGKPIVEGGSDETIGVSVSHTGTFLIVVAGFGEQGCDIEEVKERTKSKWVEILGQNKLLDDISLKGYDINIAGTIMWSVHEAISKTKEKDFDDLYSEQQGENNLFFRSKSWAINESVLVQIIRLTKGDIKIITLFVYSTMNIQENSLTSSSSKILKEHGFNEQTYAISMDYTGPQKQLVFSRKSPITFRQTQHLSRKVYFTNYFTWMGEVREYGGYSIFGDLAKLAGVGGWGMATNYIKLNVLGDIDPSDIVESSVWVESVSGERDEVVDMAFEWRRVSIDGRCERVALGKQRITWVKIIERGLAKVEPLPDFLREFIDGMKPRTKNVQSLEKLTEPYEKINLGKELFSIKDKIREKHKLFEECFPTSIANSNFIGNIYFANYPEWLGVVRDLYFYKLAPKYYSGLGENGELICLNCDIDYLSEAMPFDKILVQMYLDTVWENGVALNFEFYLVNKDKSLRKLAFGKQKCGWIKWSESLSPVAVHLPNEIKTTLLKEVQ